MIGMILGVVVSMSIGLIIQALQYGVMAYVVARCARMGWKGK